MAQVTNEMIYQAALDLKAQTESLREDMDDCTVQLRAIAGHLNATHRDVRNIQAILMRQDATLEGIERRLGIGETIA
jgi:hypothetical protein